MASYETNSSLERVSAALIKERDMALANISLSQLSGFTFMYSDEDFGKEGKIRTLTETIADILRLSAKAEILEGKDSLASYYNWRERFEFAELSDEEKKAKAKKIWIKAGKQILFLNAICRKNLGRYFILKRFDNSNAEDMKALVLSFEWCVSHYYMG